MPRPMTIARLARFILPLTVAVALASCTSVAPDPFLTTQSVEPEAPPAATDVSADFAAAYLPTFAGAIQSVRQSLASNSLHQEIVYANQTTSAGENMLTIDVGAPEGGKLLRPPSQWQVRNEMRAVLPGMNPAISPVIGNNVSGAYGYATVAINNGACIYAWQYVKQVTPADSIGFGKLTGRHLAATIRLRYCHPSIPADRIHVLMDGVRIKDINSQTIDMLRFAAGTANVAQPLAVVTPEPVVTKRRVIRQAAVVSDDDWRQAPQKTVSENASPDVIDNAAAVPLPEATDDQPVSVRADHSANVDEQAKISDAVQVPVPE